MNQPFKFFPRQLYDGMLLTMLFILSNRRLLICWYVTDPKYYCEYGSGLTDYILWGLVVLGAILLLTQRGKFQEYWQAWQKNWVLGLFLLYAMASVSWSIAPERSLHTIYIMVAAALTGTIVAIIYSQNQLLKAFYYFTTTCGIISLILALAYPKIGIHQDQVWAGAWRGIFVHKNDLGSLMALANGLSLISFFMSKEKLRRLAIISSYLLTLFLIFVSRSATGLVLWAVLNGTSLIYFFVRKRTPMIQENGIVRIVGMIVAIALLGLVSLVAVVLLLGKSFTLSGRIPMWANLLKYVVPQRPWFGYGLETLWFIPEFQTWMGEISRWGIANVLNGHSGYLDTLLSLGIVGTVLLLIILIQVFIYTIRQALTGSNWLNFFPLLTLGHFLITNITSSYILHIESFYWAILMMLIFLSTKNSIKQNELETL